MYVACICVGMCCVWRYGGMEVRIHFPSFVFYKVLSRIRNSLLCEDMTHTDTRTHTTQNTPHILCPPVPYCLVFVFRYVPVMTSRVYWHRIRYGSVVLANGEDEEISQPNVSGVCASKSQNQGASDLGWWWWLLFFVSFFSFLSTPD